MRYICTRCKSTSADGNLWCQEVNCPAGTLPLLMQYGDMLGSLKIDRLLCVLPHAVIYEAARDDKRYLLKVANPGPESEDALHREADALYFITFSKFQHPAIPEWVQHDGVNRGLRYGIIEFQNQPRHYLLMKWVEGDILSALLLDNPQMWHMHVGWFMLTLTEAIIRLHQSRQVLHLNINPDVILVRRNALGIPQPLLLDLGVLIGVNTEASAADVAQWRRFSQPAYTPPEMITGGLLTYSADVHGLGILLYALLEGKPAFPQALRTADAVLRAVESAARPAVTRADLPSAPVPDGKWRRKRPAETHPLAKIVEWAIARKPEQRFKKVDDFWMALYALYGDVPDKRRLDVLFWARNAAIAVVVIAVASLLLACLSTLVIAAVGSG
jgi:serine/threonine protein kinase